MKAKDKAIKLLKLAQDQEGTPEGDIAFAMAQALIEKHGLDLTEDDLEEEQAADRVFFAQHQERIDWREMLLVTLCDVVHGGVVMPTWAPNGDWQLWVVQDEVVDMALLRIHYDYLCNHVERLLDWRAHNFVQHYDADTAVRQRESFALGAMAYIAETLIQVLTDEGFAMEFDELPFMYKPSSALQEAPEEAHREPPTPAEPPRNDLPALFDSFADQVQGAQEVFREKLPAPQTSLPPPPPPPIDENVEVTEPDWWHFDQGRRMAQIHIRDDVLPDEDLDP